MTGSGTRPIPTTETRPTNSRGTVAFYAPLKPPDHDTPSGDRAIARSLLQALEISGRTPLVASRLRSYTRSPDLAALAALSGEAARERVALAAAWDAAPPALWLTYHPYFKAPDLIGPPLSRRWRIPYVTVEASHARKRSRDAWAPWQAAAEDALSHADAHVCFTPRDREGLAAFLGQETRLVDLAPFLDLADRPVRANGAPGGPVRLVTVAMMRPGKRRSYTFLAQALAHLTGDWRLTVVGDGPDRAGVEAAFTALSTERITWLGALDAGGVQRTLALSDIFVWPGLGEAFGLAYLEAQAAGLPVVALDVEGVASAVDAGRTALLLPDGDPALYARAIGDLTRDPDRRRRMGEAACRFTQEERSLTQAAAKIDRVLSRIMAAHRG